MQVGSEYVDVEASL